MPGGPSWWATETHIFWDNGEIALNANDGFVWRVSSQGQTGPGWENFSLWSEEKRREVKEAITRQVAVYDQEKAARDEQELATLVSIKSKLTADEWAYFKCNFEYRPDCGWPDEPADEA